jgi:hypothetical protein
MTTEHKQAQPAGVVEIVTTESAITADNTAVAVPCAGAKRIGIVFTEGGTVLNRSGVLTVTVSMDGTNFYAYSMLISNLANAITEGFTRVASITRASAGTDICWMTPETLGPIIALKTNLDITDGGTPTGNYTIKVVIQY